MTTLDGFARRALRLGLIATACNVLLPSAAAAQSEPNEVREDEETAEIVVTASRRIDNSQSTPIAVSAVSGDIIEARLNATLFDVAPQLPGLTLNGTAGYGNFPIGVRGIASSTSLIGADDPVAVYLDGVYLGKPSAVMGDLLNLAEIQVIRGPQGSLYGRNATAGAVLVTRREPGRRPEFAASASYGSFDRWRLSGRAAGPIAGDDVRAGLVLAHSDAEGWGTNRFDGSDVVRRRSTAGLGTLLFDGGPVKAVLRFDYMDERVHDGYKKLNATPYVATRPNIADASLRGDESVFGFDYPTFLDHAAGGVTLNMEANVAGLKLRSVSAWREDDVQGSIDTDGTVASISTNRTDEHHEQFTQSLILSDDTDDGSWIAGIDAYYGDTELVQVVGVVPIVSSLTIGADAEVSAIGGFFELTHEFSDLFAVTAGSRLNYDHKNYVSSGGGAGVFPTTPPITLEDSWISFTPSLRLSFTPTEDWLIYASAAKGFKSGGMTALQATSFAPETVWSYELGSKWTSPDGGLRINGDVFYADYKDLQVRVSRGIGIIETLNAASATVKGAELEASWIPVDQLRLSGFVNYVDAKYDAYIGPGPFDNAGETLNRAPKWQAGSVVAFERQTGIGSFSAEAVYSYRSRIFFSAPNVAALSSEAYGQLDLRGGFESPDGSWTLSIVGKNLTDDRHVNNVIIFGGNLVATFNEPRSVQLQAGFRF